jgi:hypothetical protein
MLILCLCFLPTYNVACPVGGARAYLCRHMCRLLAFATEDPARYAPLLEAALRDLGSMASCGNVLRVARPGHRDGWGIVAYRRGKVVLYIRVTSIGADEDPRFSAVRGLCNFCLSVARCLAGHGARLGDRHLHKRLFVSCSACGRAARVCGVYGSLATWWGR